MALISSERYAINPRDNSGTDTAEGSFAGVIYHAFFLGHIFFTRTIFVCHILGGLAK